MAGLRLGRDQTVVVAIVIVPEDLLLSPVADTELHAFGRFHPGVWQRDVKGEGVGVRTTVHVVQVLTRNVPEGHPQVKGDPERHRLFEANILDLDGAGERTFLDGAVLQGDLLGF